MAGDPVLLGVRVVRGGPAQRHVREDTQGAGKVGKTFKGVLNVIFNFFLSFAFLFYIPDSPSPWILCIC